MIIILLIVIFHNQNSTLFYLLKVRVLDSHELSQDRTSQKTLKRIIKVRLLMTRQLKSLSYLQINKIQLLFMETV